MGIDGAELKRRKERAERIAKKIGEKEKNNITPREISGETISERLGNMAPEQRDLALKTFLFIGLFCLLLGWWGWHKFTEIKPEQTIKTQAATISKNKKPDQPINKSSHEGTISRDLGIQGVSFGSQRQAQAILQFMEEWPGRNEYLVSYKTDVDTVTFSCNFEHGTILRQHDYPNGDTQLETWRRYITERLVSASSGGSLNDTPQGKVPGESTTFRR